MSETIVIRNVEDNILRVNGITDKENKLEPYRDEKGIWIPNFSHHDGIVVLFYQLIPKELIIDLINDEFTNERIKDEEIEK